MKEKNIVYLLGAGASIQAIPTVDKFNEDMYAALLQILKENDFATFIPGTNINEPSSEEKELEALKREVIMDREWFYTETSKHKSVDTLAKRLFLTDDQKGLKKLKALVSLYLIWKQVPQNYDSRYDSFFATLLYREDGKIKFPSNIRFISWNYDLQFEIALINYLKKSLITELHREWSVWPNSYSSKNIEAEPFLIKLNGSAGLYWNKKSNKVETIIEDLLSVKGHTSNQIDILKKYKLLRDDIEIESLVNFAWEASQLNEYSDNQASLLLSQADKIVIIGYSFPIFNKLKDTMIFDGLKKHKNPSAVSIYIQDPNAEAIAQKLKSSFSLIKTLIDKRVGDGPLQLIPINNVDQFFTPDDLN